MNTKLFLFMLLLQNSFLWNSPHLQAQVKDFAKKTTRSETANVEGINKAVIADLSGKELLQKILNYHDPKKEWAKFQGKLQIEAAYEGGMEAKMNVVIDRPMNYFRLTEEEHKREIIREVQGEECSFRLDGTMEFTEKEAKKYKLNCAYNKRNRDYYLYLFGLPMKLEDVGTIIHPVVEIVDFNKKKYLQLKVSYDPKVGQEIWVFFINPTNYRMEGCQFYKDEVSKKGEYILMEGDTFYGKMRIPSVRDWYIYPENFPLGKDVLRTIERL